MIEIGKISDGRSIYSKAPLVSGANYVIEPDKHGTLIAIRTNRQGRRRHTALHRGRSVMTLRAS